MRDADLEEALARKRRVQEEGKEAFDATHNVRHEPLKVGDMVLRYDKVINDIDMSLRTKLNYRWLGPYRIHSVNPVGSFKLAELDHSILGRSFTGSQLKRFIERDRFFVRQLATDEDPDPDTDPEDADAVRPSSATRMQGSPVSRRTRSTFVPRSEPEPSSALDSDTPGPEEPSYHPVQHRNLRGIVIHTPVLIEAEKAQYIRFDYLDDSSN